MPKWAAPGNGRAPDVFRRGGWVPMTQHPENEPVDFAIVGTGCGCGVLAAKLAEAGFSVVAFDAGPFFRPLEDFASDEREQEKLYWLDERISGGDDPIELGSNNSGRCVGGTTVHFQMVALRFRPEWFKARSKLGYGHDWPVDVDDHRRQLSLRIAERIKGLAAGGELGTHARGESVNGR